MDLCLLNVTLIPSMLDLCYLWYSCDTAWDICVIMWWMCHIYVTLVWNVYMFFLWRWMWLIHKNRKHIKKQQQFAECFYPDTRQSNHFSISWKTYLPSVITLALGEVSNFAECLGNYTRQIYFPVNRKWLLCLVSG